MIQERPAFPTTYTSIGTTKDGLTKREYIAALALQGILSNPLLMEGFLQAMANKMIVPPPAAMALDHADNLLRYLEMPLEIK